MELAVGTPPVTVQALFGISDLCWVECTPCSGCNNNAAPPAGARLYDRANSSSFSPLACASQACKVLPDRAGPHDVQRHRVRVPSFTFGCTNTVYRNDLFDGTRGVAFQIGAPATLLVEPAYTAVVEAFRARMSRTYEAVNGSGLLCFLVDDASKKVVTVPTMTMHFDGMDMELLFGNYFAYTGKQSGGGGGDVLCLMIGKSSTGSRIGNYLQISLPMGWIGMGLMDWFSIWIHLAYLQMDFHVMYDLKNSVLSVQPADCGKI
ncbi:hypothetical protein OsI_26308 [Oryza sativa Indica Group]|uniref:Peptidase A1 domain-containing protein n=1 Tax=Oryza sativa subsp. indica TaxID=39946 RepID=A2YM55_ORYSI|nr:hypothetical protein OsI_26308 [Oryza sativa Indica Group]